MSPPYILAGDIQDEIGGRTKLSGIDHLCIVKFSKYMRRSHGNDNMLKLCLSVQAYDDFCKYFFSITEMRLHCAQRFGAKAPDNELAQE